jgi:hypothetical protein
MASKRRIRRNMCDGKKRHRSEQGAIIAIKKTASRHPMRPYRCRFCGCWHIGHAQFRISR